MLTHYVKVKIKGMPAFYLRGARYITRELADLRPPSDTVHLYAERTFLTGTEVRKDGDEVIRNGAERMHLIEMSENVKVTNQQMNRKYGELERDKDGD